MPEQIVNVDLNIITTCDFTLSVLFDDKTNELPAVTLINVNYNDEDVFSDNNIDSNKVYTSTKGELKKITLKFWAKNYANSNGSDSLSTNIFITVSNSNDTKKSVTEKYAIIRYNSLYEKYSEDEEIIVDEGRWQLIESSLRWQEIRDDWDSIGINDDQRWMESSVIIPNTFRKVKIKYTIQNLDTSEEIQETTTLEVVRGNSLKSSIGIDNSKHLYVLYNKNTHKAYKEEDFDHEMTEDDIALMYPNYNDITDVMTYVLGEGQFISIQVKFRQQVFPAELIYNIDPFASSLDLYTYLVTSLNLMLRVKNGNSTKFASMLGSGSWDNPSDEKDLLYWVYLDDEELDDFNKIQYNSNQTDSASVVSSFNNDDDNTNHLKLYSKWNDGSPHTLRFIPINEITKSYKNNGELVDNFEDIIDLFSVVFENVNLHDETIDVSMVDFTEEFTYSKVIEKIPAKINYLYTDTLYRDNNGGDEVKNETYIFLTEYGTGEYTSIPNMDSITMSYTYNRSDASSMTLNLSDTIDKEENDGVNSIWYSYLADLIRTDKEFFDNHGEDINNDYTNDWIVNINQSSDFKNKSDYRGLPSVNSPSTLSMKIVSKPAITIPNLKFDTTSRQGINVIIDYPSNIRLNPDQNGEKDLKDENFYKIQTSSDSTEYTLNSLVLISIIQENLINTSPSLIKENPSGSDMFRYKINHASFNKYQEETETTYIITSNNTTEGKVLNTNETKVFSAGDTVELRSSNDYSGISKKEYAYMFDKYYDSTDQERLSYVIENREIYYGPSVGSNIYTYLYNGSNLSSMSYYSFYQGHNYNKHVSYTVSNTGDLSNYLKNISLVGNKNVFKTIIKKIINEQDTLSIGIGSNIYSSYFNVDPNITIDNTGNYSNIYNYQTYLFTSQNTSSLDDYDPGKIYFNGENLYYPNSLSFNSNNFYNTLKAQTYTVEVEVNEYDNPDDPTEITGTHTDTETRNVYSETEITNITNTVAQEINSIKDTYKTKLISLVVNNEDYSIYTSSTGLVTFNNGIYFKTPTELDDSYTIRYCNGFNLFTWNLFETFNPEYYSIKFYEYNSSDSLINSWWYHGVEVIHRDCRYNIGVFVLNSTSQNPDFWIFTDSNNNQSNQPFGNNVYNLDYFNSCTIEYNTKIENNAEIIETFGITLGISNYNDIIPSTTNVDYNYGLKNNGSNYITSPTISQSSVKFLINYVVKNNDVFYVQRKFKVPGTNDYVYGPVNYIYLPERQERNTDTIYKLVQHNAGDEKWKLFDIPNDADGKYNISNSELFLVRYYPGQNNEYSLENDINDKSFDQSRTVLFLYDAEIKPGEKNENYDIEYTIDDENTSSSNPDKAIFGLCDRHRSLFNVLPGISKEYSLLIPRTYRDN